MSERPRIERFGRRRPFNLRRGAPKPGRYPPDSLDLDAAAEAVATALVEIGYGFDAAGRQVFRQVGVSDVMTGFRPADLTRLRDGVFLHNHPPYDYPTGDPRRSAGSFSASDLVFMYEHDLAEMVLVTEERRYRLRRLPVGFFLDPDQIRQEHAALTDEVRQDLDRRVAHSELSAADGAAEARLADSVMDLLAPFFDYVVERRR